MVGSMDHGGFNQGQGRELRLCVEIEEIQQLSLVVLVREQNDLSPVGRWQDVY